METVLEVEGDKVVILLEMEVQMELEHQILSTVEHQMGVQISMGVAQTEDKALVEMEVGDRIVIPTLLEMDSILTEMEGPIPIEMEYPIQIQLEIEE